MHIFKPKNIFSLAIAIIVGFAILPNFIYASTLSFSKDQNLKNQAFYESEGTLKITDTTIHQHQEGGFSMDKARYAFKAPSQISTQSPVQINYQNLTISLTPQNIQNSQGHLTENEKEILYENVYGKGTSLGFITDPLQLQKIIKLTKEATATAELSFKFSVPKDTIFTTEDIIWNQKKILEVTGHSIKISHNQTDAYIQPAKAWDSNGNEIEITLTLAKQSDGTFLLTKHLPKEWLQTAIFPIYTDATISFGTEATFNSGTTGSGLSVATLDSTHVVVVYTDSGDSNKGNAAVGTISGTTISFGAETTFNATIATPSVTALDSTHVVIVYVDTSAGDIGNAVVGTISGTSISFGTEATFDSGVPDNPLVTAIDSTHVVVVYSDPNGKAVVGTVSGTTISFETEVTFNNATTASPSISTLDSTHVVVVYADDVGSNGRSVVGTISGVTISFGAEATFDSGFINTPSVSTLDSTHVVVVYADATDSKGNAAVGTISGTTISFGTEATFNNASTTTPFVTTIDSTHVVVVYRDSGNSSYGTSAVGTISGTTISFGAEAVFNSGTTITPAVSTIDSTHVAVIYRDSGDTSKGNAIIGTASLPFTVGGTVYTDEGTTNIGTGKTVAISINGAAAAGTDDTDASGVFSITDLTFSANDVLTLYIDGETEKGVTVTLAAASNLSSINIFQNYLITRCDNSCSLSNSNLDTANNNADTDITDIYTGTTTITTGSGIHLYIPSSHTFAPANPVSVGGNFANNGTFTHGSSTLTLTSTSASATLKTNSSSLYNLIINGSGSTYTPQDATTVANDLTITAGTLSMVGSAFTVSGATSISGTISTATSATGTKTFTGAVTVASGGTLNMSGQNPVVALGAGLVQSSSNLANIGSGSNTLVGNLSGAGAGGITFGGALAISSGTTTNSYTGGTVTVTGTLTLTGNWAQANGSSLSLGSTTPFAGAGTFSASTATNTVSYTGGAATIKTPNGGTANTYSNLSLSGSGAKTMTSITTTNNFTMAGSASTSGNVLTTITGDVDLSGTATMTLGANLVVTGNVTIGSGATLDASSSNFNITATSNWSNSGTFTARSGTVTLSASGTHVLTGATTFYNLTLPAPNTVTFPASTTQTIGNTLSCTGTAGNVITINSSSSGTAATLSKSTGTVTCDYLSLQDSTGTGGATWTPGANSTNVSGNSGWVFDNSGPTVDVGANVTANAIFTTTATASDSSGISSYLWTKQSGSGDVYFGTPTTLNTTISATDGTYTIRLTVTDTLSNSNYDEFTLTWSPANSASTTSTGSGGASSLVSLIRANDRPAPAPITVLPPPSPPLKYIFPRYLGYGDRGTDVFQLQTYLQTLGFFPTTITPNGNYGPATRASVRKFQQAHGISPVGVVGPLTRRALNNL